MESLIKYLLAVFFLSSSVIFLYAQDDKTLQDKIDENKQLLIIDSNKAFSRIDDLMVQVKREGDKESELTLLSHRCWYFISKDLKEAISSIQALQDKAKEYRNIYYQATAHVHFSSVYARSELPDKALEEFELAIKLIEKIKDKSKKQDIFYLKANAYIGAGNVYRYKKQPHKVIQMLLKANEEINKLEDSEEKKILLRANYTNIGGSYAEVNKIDSAEYFVNKSFLLSKNKEDLIQFNNYLILGAINKRKQNYPKALENYKKAENKISYVNPSLDKISIIYRNLAEIYKNTDSLEQANYYVEQLQHSLLRNEQNKNQSLHKIIDEKLLKEKNYSLYIGISSSVLILLISVFMIRLYRKNKLLAEQEKISEQYLEEHKEVKIVDENTLSTLTEMVKNNDEAFMPAFYNSFPDFLEKLQAIHPKIVPTEVEFCALLKLNLLTKDIARYKNIEPKSVQNKKYRIRKKLNIPDDVDIYFWFNKF